MGNDPCRCKFGHGFSREDAESLGYKCDKDGSPITCRTDAPSPGGEQNGGQAGAGNDG